MPSPLPHAEDFQHFQDWVSHFKCKSCSTYNDGKSLKKKSPVPVLLAKISTLSLARGTSDRLERNILFACFKAENAPDPDKDEAAEHRKKFRKEFDGMVRHRNDVARVRAYFADHRSMASKAMAHADISGARRMYAVTSVVRSEVDDLKTLLSRYETGLIHIGDFDHPTHITAEDFRFGPFEMHNDLYGPSAKLRNINQTGLMFHLAYLFQCFTSPKLPPLWVDNSYDILNVAGEMLSGGPRRPPQTPPPVAGSNSSTPDGGTKGL